jgi:hypothetical protein
MELSESGVAVFPGLKSDVTKLNRSYGTILLKVVTSSASQSRRLVSFYKDGPDDHRGLVRSLENTPK